MRIYENGAYTPEYLAECERIEELKAKRGETKPFVVGQSYQTVSGDRVTCTQLSGECVRFSDGEDAWYSRGGYFNRHTGAWVQQTWHRTTTGWRYNRDDIDRGRVTGSPFDHSDPRCVIPESVKP